MSAVVPAPAMAPSLLSQLTRLAIPLALIQLGQVTMGLVDTAMLGRVDAAQLAAAGIGNAIFFGVVVLGMGTVLGSETLASQAVGAGAHRAAAKAYRQGVWVALGVSLPLAIVVYAVMLYALPVVKVAPDLTTASLSYINGRMAGLPAFLIYIAQRAYLQAYGKTTAPTVAMVIANVINIPADYLLIFGDEGLTEIGLGPIGLSAMGAQGAGIATAIAAWLQVLLVVPAVMRVTHAYSADAKGAWRRALVEPGKLKIVRVGAPVGFQYALEVSIFALVALAMGRLSTVSAAANQVALNLVSTSFSAVLGVSMATSTLVGRYVGANAPTLALRAGLLGIGIGASIMAFSGATFFFFGDQMARWFSEDPAVVAGTVVLLQIAAFFQVADGVQAVACGALRGGGDTDAAFVGNLVAYWVVGLPVAYVLGFVLDWKAPGLWWGLTAGLVVAAAGLTTRFYVKARKGYEAVASA